MKFTLTQRKQTASFRMAGSMLAIAPLWLMLAAANTSAYAQTSDNVSKASATTSTAPSPGDWTQFHRDNMQRWNPYETVLGVSSVGSLRLKWENPIGGTDSAVANGVVYVGSGGNGYTPWIGDVFALNASTGAPLWYYYTSGTVASPAVANGVVYVATFGGIDALNASTGAKLWSFATPSYVISSPAVANLEACK
jgi:outer membrane protein assembly factor BamB